MMRDHLIIFFPWVDWDGPKQRYQHLALNFSKTNHVAYMNPTLAITYLTRSPGILVRNWIRWLLGKRKISSNLTIYFTPPCLPFGRQSRWINYCNQYILFFYINLFVRRKERLILWINNPYNYLMIKLLKPKITVYDCPDAIVFRDGRRQKLYDGLKKRTIQDSTVCLFTSKSLLYEGKKYSENSFYVPNGVEIGNFLVKKCKTPEIMRNIRETILGLVGTFDERLDIDLLNFILDNLQKATLVMVGPVKVKLGNFGKHQRVILVGKREYEEIPSFINTFDVALIPYRINQITNAVYPVKLHEYLILGKPVVSTNLPEVRQFSDVVWIAGSKEEFVSCIEKALDDYDETIREKRKRIARMNSWERRMDQIEEIMAKYC